MVTEQILSECPRCDGAGVVSAGIVVPQSHFAPAEHLEDRCSACKGAGEVPAVCGCCDEPATETSLAGQPLCGQCAEAIQDAASALLHAVRTPLPPPPDRQWADVAVVRILAAARVWLPAARLEVRLSASVRLARLGVRRFPRAANRMAS